MTISVNDDIELIERIERIDSRGRHIIEIREIQADLPRIPNHIIFGTAALLRREGLEAIGNFETGEVVFRPRGVQSR